MSAVPRLLRFITDADVEVEELSAGHHAWLSRPGLTEAEHLMMVRVTMPPGKQHAFHRHPRLEELLYIISGTAEHWVEHEKRLLGPGDTSHIPADVVHGTYNVGPDPLVFLAILSPALFEESMTIDVSQEPPWNTLRK